MVIRRGSGEIEHRHFRDLPSLLLPSDLLVLNETRVIPAALSGSKATGGRVEMLVLDPARAPETSHAQDQAVRTCMVNASKPVRAGMRITLDTGAELVAVEALDAGRCVFRFPVPEAEVLDFLRSHGTPPLPPYIKPEGRSVARDRERYQTVYAKIPGSVAAPTAGLHFTDGLLTTLAEQGIETARILLHVGPGTFTPVREEDIRCHKMEPEFYEISGESAQIINKAYQEGRRIIAVGTTAVRALEAAATQDGIVAAGRGKTDLFILPGYAFKVVRGMITNFHLPGSTLLMLVCALGGADLMLGAYDEAVRSRYRFYSYGDASLIIDDH
jgi:S-adenosylmethionine:tRNA ribosyltransferase-isomerase